MLRVTNLAGFGAGSRGVSAPAQGDPFWDSVVLLAGFDGADGATAFSDESPAAHGAFTFANQAQLDTGQKKFGTASLRIDGISDNVQLADHADWNFGSGQFTVEAFLRINDLAANSFLTVVSHFEVTGNQKAWILDADLTTDEFRFAYTTDGSTVIQIRGDFTFLENVWYHVAVDRDASDKIRSYVDGDVVGGPTAAADTIFDSTTNLIVGAAFGGSVSELDGWIDEIRITKGVARYGGAFTPPTAKFPRF